MILKNKSVAVIGYGIEGIDLLDYLLGKGAIVEIFDWKKKSELDLSLIDKKRIKTHFGKDYLKQDLTRFDVIFRSPGVYRYLPKIIDAEKSGVPISSSTKLFFDLCPAKIIGVTGTKGKGTTASLIHEILKTDGFDVHLAGNIGRPMLKLLPQLNNISWVVLELSSFQLIDLTKSPHVAVVLNISSDHLDWHKDIEEYKTAKESIVKFQDKNDYSVINYDYEASKSFEKLTNGKVFYFGKRDKVRGAYISNQEIILDIDQKHIIGSTKNLLLRGEHNWENVTAAICASNLAGASVESIKKATFSFKGLEHRLEFVDTIKDVSFYNDSFGTGPDTVVAAVNSFEEPTTVILGGFDKGLDYTNMAKVIADRKNVETVVLIGDIGKQIESDLKDAKFLGQMIYLGKPTMKAIVDKAIELTTVGGVVLLAPGSSSFDMFESYKDRGNQFKNAVKNLKLTKK